VRVFAVNTNGNLLDSLTFTGAEIDATGVFDILFQPGVSNTHVTVELNLETGSVAVDISGPIAPAADGRKGWDGCIYGPDRPVKKPTSRVMLVPPVPPPAPPATELYMYASGVPEVGVEDPTVTASRRKWSDGHVTLMKAYDDGETMEFRSFATGGGVHVDLGHAESFEMSLHKFEDGDIPDQDQLLTRTIGPIALTNRPPPPFLDALLLQGPSNAVQCSADFNNLGSPTVRVMVLSNGVLVADHPGIEAHLGQTLLTLPEWPLTMGKLAGATPCRRIIIKTGTIRLPGGAGAPFGLAASGTEETVIGDEVRVVAELPPGAPHPDFYSAFEFITNDGPTWQVSDLQRTLACSPEPLTIARASDGIHITWSGEGFRLQGAEDVTGPWIDLGPASPVSLEPNHAARFFRLICD